MATFVVCARCGKTQEIAVIDQFPATWRYAESMLLCPRCAAPDLAASVGDVLEEEVIHPPPGADTLDDSFESECTVCHGPCRGH